MGTTQVFILPLVPVDGIARLVYGRSLLPGTDLELVEEILAKAREYRSHWLALARSRAPAKMLAAESLEAELRRRRAAWPRGDDREPESANAEPLVREVVDGLATVDVETIQIALALNWLKSGTDAWHSHGLWGRVERTLDTDRKDEVRKLLRGELDRLLDDSKLEVGARDHYLASLGGEGLGGFGFPYEGPGSRQHFDASAWTSDFILRLHRFDRGQIYAAYGMQPRIRWLQVSRLENLLIGLEKSRDEAQRYLAGVVRAAAADSRKTLDVVYRKLLAEFPQAWLALCDDQDPMGTRIALQALIDFARQEGTAAEIPRLWLRLVEGKCHRRVVVEEALVALERFESDPASDPYSSAPALGEYLLCAMRVRSPELSPLRTSSEYRDWFREHPPEE